MGWGGGRVGMEDIGLWYFVALIGSGFYPRIFEFQVNIYPP